MTKEFGTNLSPAFDAIRDDLRTVDAVPVVSALLLLHTIDRFPEHCGALDLALPDGATHELQQSLHLPGLLLEGYMHGVLGRHIHGQTWSLQDLNLNEAALARASRAVGSLVGQLTAGLDGAAALERLGSAFTQLLDYVVRQFAKSSGFVQTPETVAQLMAELLDARPGMSVLDSTAGHARTLMEVARLQRRHGADPNTLRYVGQEIDAQSALVGAVHLLLNGVTSFTLHVGDVLTNPQTGQGEFDRVIADPAVSLPVPHLVGHLEHDPRFVFGKKGLPKVADWLFLQHGLTSLKPGGRAVFMTAHGPMFRGGTEGSIRKDVLATGWLNAVMALPSSLYPNTGIPMVLSLFDRPAPGQQGQSDVLMIDASGLGVRQGRTHMLDEDLRTRLARLLHERDGNDELAELVDHDRIQRNDGAWQPNQYQARTVEQRTVAIIRKELKGKLEELVDAETKFKDALANLESSRVIGQTPTSR